MRVFTYACTSDAPAGAEFFARIRCDMSGFQGKRYEDWHPVLIPGTTADEARAKAQVLQSQVQQVQQVRQQPAGPDPRVVQNAQAWMQANPWYNPNSNDRDSVLTKTIDAQLVREGYNPASIGYWEELTARVADALGEPTSARQQSSDPARRKAPPTGNTREHAPVSTRREIYVTPERKQAMIDAGVWDDPVKRQRMLKSYQDFDRQSAAR